MKKFVLFIFCFYGFAYGIYPMTPYNNIPYNTHTITKSNLHKDNSGLVEEKYYGKITASGIIEWHPYHKADGDYYGWELRFYPDDIHSFPVDKYDKPSAQYGIRLVKKEFETILQDFDEDFDLQDLVALFGQDFHKNDKYIFGGVAIRANITLFDYVILHNDDYDIGLTIAKYKNINNATTLQRFYDKHAPAHNRLSYASKDSYINLRESPNGKVLNQILKESIHSRCANDFNDITKGFIIFLGKDSANPKWYKVAYIPPNAKDTREAIYGVSHSSQVGFECGE